MDAQMLILKDSHFSFSIFRTLNGIEATICKYRENASDGYIMIFKYPAE
jgi:hypothetical protein